MLFRGRQPASTVWRRFRSGIDEFTFARDGDHYEARVAANAERVVDLFHALAEHLPPAVDVAVEDVRTGRAWRGTDVALPDLREAVARLKVPLAAYGGVELAVYSTDDQLTLTPDLELYVYAVTDRWLYLLQGKGLAETVTPEPEAWRLHPEELGAAPALDDALAAAAARLGLEPVAPGTGERP
jgi:hypothetical protein